MEIQFKLRVRRWQMLSVITAVYLPSWVGFAFGAAHCDTCRRAWLWIVWVVPAGVVQEITRGLFELPQTSEGLAFGSALLVQGVWISGWCWLATLERWSFWGVLVVTLAASSYSSWVAYWMMRW